MPHRWVRPLLLGTLTAATPLGGGHGVPPSRSGAPSSSPVVDATWRLTPRRRPPPAGSGPGALSACDTFPSRRRHGSRVFRWGCLVTTAACGRARLPAGTAAFLPGGFSGGSSPTATSVPGGSGGFGCAPLAAAPLGTWHPTPSFFSAWCSCGRWAVGEVPSPLHLVFLSWLLVVVAAGAGAARRGWTPLLEAVCLGNGDVGCCLPWMFHSVCIVASSSFTVVARVCGATLLHLRRMPLRVQLLFVVRWPAAVLFCRRCGCSLPSHRCASLLDLTRLAAVGDRSLAKALLGHLPS